MSQLSGHGWSCLTRYAGWASQYERATEGLAAEGSPVTLRAVLAAMRADDAAG